MTKRDCLMVLLISFSLLLPTYFDAPLAGNNNKGGIRGIDFLNHEYSPTLCQREYGKDGIGRKVILKNGEFKIKDVYYEISGKKIIYGDLNNDGDEDAVIWISCGVTTYSYCQNEVLVYTLKDGKEKLLANIDDDKMNRDYKKYYKSSKDNLGLAIESLKVSNNKLIIEKYSEGPECCPEHLTKLEYKWNGSLFVLANKPDRKKVVK
jgi:hypothetical protein